MQNQPKKVFPAERQDVQPGTESAMAPAPVYDNPAYRPANKLQGKTALVTGGDSGIGRAVALGYAKEGANVSIVYLGSQEDNDADETVSLIKAIGGNVVKYRADLRNEDEAANAVKFTADSFGGLDILVNNAAVQYPQNSISDISREQLANTFGTNIYSYFFATKAALPHLESKPGSTIINTASVVAFRGSPRLIDYSATKGAIASFTRSMAMSLVKQGIRVNAVAPGLVWTPLIVSSFSAEEAAVFGSNTPMGRAAQPYELAPLYVFLANDDSSNITGQVFHVNSGEIVD
jgi:NAD(P)-dependent dehydrogenase (short-subunit alcohol dehydrogenase family)